MVEDYDTDINHTRVNNQLVLDYWPIVDVLSLKIQLAKKLNLKYFHMKKVSELNGDESDWWYEFSVWTVNAQAHRLG